MSKYRCTNAKWPQFGQVVEVEETNACGRKAIRYEVLYEGPEGTAIYTKAVFEKNFELVPERETFVIDNAELLEEILELNQHVKEQEELLKADKAQLLEKLTAANINTIEAFGSRISVVDAADIMTFDTKGFKKDYPTLYDRYSTPSHRAAYLKIR